MDKDSIYTSGTFTFCVEVTLRRYEDSLDSVVAELREKLEQVCSEFSDGRQPQLHATHWFDDEDTQEMTGEELYAIDKENWIENMRDE